MRRHIGVASLVSCIVVIGCETAGPPVGSLAGEGFEAFATPRSFDGPGTLFRIGPDRKRHLVTILKVKPSGGGVEVVPKFTSNRDLSADQLLQSIGAKAEVLPANIKANLTSQHAATIEATTASRARLSDEDVRPALREWAIKAAPPHGSVYYLIRETIATTALTYKVSKSWLATIGLDVQILRAAGYTSQAKSTSGDVLELDAKFNGKLNVWYKAERITLKESLGAGPGQYTVDVVPAEKGILNL